MMTLYPTLSLLIFILPYSLSYFISIHILRSREKILELSFMILIYFVSRYFVLHKKYIAIGIVSFCFISGVMYIAYSIYPNLLPFLKAQSLQFILPTDSGHNHLGDLMGLGIVSLFITSFSPIFRISIGLFFISLMIVSFSKSAFLALIATFIYILILNKKKYIALLLFILCVSFISFILYTKELSVFKPVATAQYYVLKKLNLTPKGILSSRDIYFTQALQSWIASSFEYSAFGYGPGNFIYASSRSAKFPEEVTTDAHNILITLGIESGWISALWFLFFVFGLIIIGWKTDNFLIFPILYLFTNFQTDYTYRILLFFVLFFFLLGQIRIIQPPSSKEKILSLFPILCACIITLFLFLYKIQGDKTYTTLYSQMQIAVQAQDVVTFKSASIKLQSFSPYDEMLLIELAENNEQMNNQIEAINLLDKLSTYSPHTYLNHLTHMFNLMKQEKIDIKSYIQRKKEDFSPFPYTKEEKERMNDICDEYAKMKCIN